MKSRSLLASLAALLERRLYASLAVLAVLVGLSAWGALNLHINTNQLQLLPQDMRAVKEAYRISDMTGGIGFFMIALKGEDEKHLKGVADDLAPRLEALPEVRYVRYKQNLDFVRKHVGLYVKTKDLAEVRKRLKAKIDDVVERADPLYLDLQGTPPVKFDVKDIVEKYRSFNKKGIADDYYITRDKKLLLLLIKPHGNATDLEFTRRLEAKFNSIIAGYNKDNKRKAVLKEGYREYVPGATVTYGYTGGYKRNVDDSDSIIDSLKPVSAISITGIFILLLIFLRRITLVASLIVSLVSGVILTFGFCYITVGELNSITAIMAGILMGQGIDFGIQFIYRVRQEYARDPDLSGAIRTSLSRLGVAAVTTAASTAAAFFALTTSDFKGFRDFGLVAGGGTFLIAGCMLYVPAMLLLLLQRLRPQSIARLLVLPPKRLASIQATGGRIPGARMMLWAGVLITAVLLVAALDGPEALREYLPDNMKKGVQFNYDARALTIKNRPSVILAEEIGERYDISSDPAGVWAPTLEEAKALYQSMTPLDPKKYSTVDAVISLFVFLPPMAQQQANRLILQQIKKDLEPIKPSMLDPKMRKLFKKGLPYLDVKPFTLAQVPDIYKSQFVGVKGSKHKGYLTFIYPKVALWDSRDLLAFSDQISEIKVKDKTYHSTGMAILFARLATIVLHDGKMFTILACVAILLILFVAMRSFTATLAALLPLVMGVTWMLGSMALLGQRINFMNVVVFPVVLGYGMGSGIYILFRFRESGSAKVAVTQTGRAVLASCVTTLVGWSSLLTAGHLGLESMGVLSSLGIGCVLITSLAVLPALLQLGERWFGKKWRHNAATEPAPTTETIPKPEPDPEPDPGKKDADDEQ